ncbi:MAG: HNH endonuclease [Melioribacteraceae bacterium]|nr:HNH endonuclease [Melioribacteraceae bacterium]
MTICNVKKAIILVFLGKAELIADNQRKKIHSISSAFPWPTVIRLNDFIRVPYKKIILTRRNILKRDGHKCAYCGRGDLPLTIDHVIPKSKGGDESWENLVAACLPCNNRKGDRTPDEVEMHLRIRPYTPNHIMFIKNTVGRVDETWKPYLFH